MKKDNSVNLTVASENMVIIDNHLDYEFGKRLVEENQKERETHKSSGKLSAGQLGSPLQWQILKSFGIFERVIDDYTLRKFERGKDIEKKYLSSINGVIDTQIGVVYRGCVGYMDAFVDTSNWEYPSGKLPLEVKSVSNAKFKRIMGQCAPDRGHALQNALYALAVNSEFFAISYIASDDYRVLTFILKTSDWKSKVDAIIDRYDAQLKTGKVPVFVPEEAWQKNAMYNQFPDWAGLTQDEIDKKFEAILLDLAKEI